MMELWLAFCSPPSLPTADYTLPFSVVANEMVGYVSQGSSGYRVGCIASS